jgi:hypothetical protein
MHFDLLIEPSHLFWHFKNIHPINSKGDQFNIGNDFIS